MERNEKYLIETARLVGRPTTDEDAQYGVRDRFAIEVTKDWQNGEPKETVTVGRLTKHTQGTGVLHLGINFNIHLSVEQMRTLESEVTQVMRF